MKWDGRQLKDLGCPQNKIKFFVNKEFASEVELLQAIQDHRETNKTDEERENERLMREDPNSAFNVLFLIGLFPWSDITQSLQPSRSEVKRWLEQGAIRINGKFPKPHECVYFPIEDLVFFPGAKRQTTFA
jgi:hypothetical protein